MPPDTGTPFLDVIREASVRLRLAELRSSRPNSTRELRLWDGFGLGGVQLVILREAKHRWRAFRAYPVDRESPVRLAPLPDTADWVGRWQAAVAAGLLQLPAYPSRDSSDFVVTDGYEAVIEWYDGTRYGITGANNPDDYCSPDDRRFLVVLAALRNYSWPNRCTGGK